MEFEEVNNFIRNNNVVSLTRPEDAILNNTYHALIQPQQAELTTKKPTLANFVSRLVQQSSKTRFVRDYKKMSSDIVSHVDLEDDASIRIIDPTRMTRGSSAEEEEEEQNSYDEYESDASEQVQNLMVGGKAIEKQPLNNNKRVQINEEANQIQQSEEEEQEVEYMTMEQAIQFIQHQEQDQLNAIQYQLKRLEIQKDNVLKYKQDLINMQKQMDFYYESLMVIKTDHVPDMKTLATTTIIKNTDLLKESKKRNDVMKYKFEKYRKTTSIEMRIQELRYKLDLSIKRDDIWHAIRDWGFLLALIFVMVVASFFAWRAG